MKDTTTYFYSCLRADQVVVGGLRTSSLGTSAFVPTVLFPENQGEVRAIVELANVLRIAVYPVSTGNNWGYGSGVPVQDGCVVVNLSRMNKVLDFDLESGCVTLEPGVTQADLHAFLEERGHAFLVPTHGGGPRCSIVGNALERGYGLTPGTDHFAHVMGLEAILGDGSIYRSSLEEAGADEAARAFKWGLGPYLDGIFTQSNVGIVTKMRVRLVRRPAKIVGFFFSVDDDAKLEPVVEAVSRVMHKLEGMVGGVNLMNARRTLSMVAPFPKDEVRKGEVLSPSALRTLGKQFGLSAWSGAGSLYGEPEVVRAAIRVIKRELGPCVDRLVFLTERRASFLSKVLSWLAPRSGLRRMLELAVSGVRVMSGIPSEVAHPLVQWKTGAKTSGDPERDGAGLIWYTPLIPLQPRSVRAYVTFLEETCVAFGMEPLVTLTTVSATCMDSSVPLLFRREDADEATRARACYDTLLQEGKKLGFVPYRLPTFAMGEVTREGSFWATAAKVKGALDPLGVVAPGRYCPAPPANDADEVQTPRPGESGFVRKPMVGMVRKVAE